MAGQVNFTREFARYGSQVSPHEKADDVSRVVAEFTCRWSYTIWQIINAKSQASG
jgi:hypothetical protein